MFSRSFCRAGPELQRRLEVSPPVEAETCTKSQTLELCLNQSTSFTNTSTHLVEMTNQLEKGRHCFVFILFCVFPIEGYLGHMCVCRVQGSGHKSVGTHQLVSQISFDTRVNSGPGHRGSIQPETLRKEKEKQKKQKGNDIANVMSPIGPFRI